MRSDDRVAGTHLALDVRPWRRESDVALLVPTGDGPPIDPDVVRRCVARLDHHRLRMAVTPALTPAEQAAFLASGFVVRERLHLLTHDLSSLPDRGTDGRLRRAHRKDRGVVLQVDGSAFDPFWRLDTVGLDEALAATPVSRFRVAGVGSDVVGYAVCGRAAKRGYVQRLAVDPRHQGTGLGRALVVDGLRWMRRRGVSEAAVNTQESNRAALALYERLGFRRRTDGLAVLSLDLEAGMP